MYNQDYDGAEYVDPSTPPNPPQTPPTNVGPNGGNATLLGYDGQTEVYQGSDGQRYILGPTGGNGFASWAPYTGTGTITPNPTSGGDVAQPTPQPPSPTPGPAPAPAPTGGGATGAPTFTPPPVYRNDGSPVDSYTAPPAFNYADFVAPDPNKLNDDPLFKFTMAREQDAISKRAAAGGTLFTGGTYDALMRSAADISSAGYQQMYNRDAQDYTMNRGNAFQNYQTNYGTQYQDPYRLKYAGAQDAYNSQIHNFDTGRSYDWARTLFGEQQANDQFDRKYRIYSSL